MTDRSTAPAVSVLVPCTRPERITAIADALAGAASRVSCELLVAGRVEGLQADSFAVPTTLIACDTSQLNRMRQLLAHRARGPVLAFLDDDAVPGLEWLDVAASLPHDSTEIWTGPEEPTRHAPGARLAAEVASSIFAEGYRGHTDVGDRPVRWYEAPFCNLIASRSLVDLVGLPEATLPWDLDDFDLCYRAAASGATFRSRRALAISHDRYPDTMVEWLRHKARERRRTGYKLIRYPTMYVQIPSVVAAVAAPWAGLAGLAVAGRRRRRTFLAAIAVYGALVSVEAHRKQRRGGSALRFGFGLTGLHVTSTCALQVGAAEGVVAAVLARPDPNLPAPTGRSHSG